MSDSPQGTPVDPSGLGYVTFYFDHRIYRCFFLVGLTILIYDHLLTLGTEVKYIWSRRLRPSTCWFLAVRYVGLGASITISVFYFGDLSHEEVLIECEWTCTSVASLHGSAGTLGLRVFAMYGLNIWILMCLLSAVGDCQVRGTANALRAWIEGMPYSDSKNLVNTFFSSRYKMLIMDFFSRCKSIP
ncbi:hypothetical protein C8F04DRAFT_1268968 [Mycena alexandri]|uniref:DUF6533 domain-containing protein n=1 Tax=Mycena alexandri TaxID=1745969 RepID=A0AAD6WYE9_9AGAR|nr:hypothetical protein C8F04DRAFT_1268968 [Mycena alexandri]